mgnify:CR=1 FL=1
MDTITVITIIAVFWLLGLLMVWSMCVVAARADHRQNMIRHARTDADTSRPDNPPCGMRRTVVLSINNFTVDELLLDENAQLTPCLISQSCHVDGLGTDLP